MTMRLGRWLRTVFVERNVVLVAAVVFVQSLAENLWTKFVPKYLESLGASAVVIGLYGTLYDLLDGLYQYPGGWLSDRVGRVRALASSIAVAAAGYVVYALAPSWELVLLGLTLVMAWHGMASPSIFAIVGDALPRERRATAFTVQSLLKRAPLAVGPVIGGWWLAERGVIGGMQLALWCAVALSAVSLLILRRVRLPAIEHEPARLAGVFRTFPVPLRRLLLSEIVVRTSEGLVDVFVVVYATTIVGVSAAEFGVLMTIQVVTSLAVYVPSARLADRVGRKPLVAATCLAFAGFPLAVVSSDSFVALAIAFVVGGLREIGEPARKAFIVDLADAGRRGRTVGLYYLIRSTSVAPAAFVGGALWRVDPALPFYAAAVVGLIGSLTFVVLVREHES